MLGCSCENSSPGKNWKIDILDEICILRTLGDNSNYAVVSLKHADNHDRSLMKENGGLLNAERLSFVNEGHLFLRQRYVLYRDVLHLIHY